jgi:hypothetical protein
MARKQASQFVSLGTESEPRYRHRQVRETVLDPSAVEFAGSPSIFTVATDCQTEVRALFRLIRCCVEMKGGAVMSMRFIIRRRGGGGHSGSPTVRTRLAIFSPAGRPNRPECARADARKQYADPATRPCAGQRVLMREGWMWRTEEKHRLEVFLGLTP